MDLIRGSWTFLILYLSTIEGHRILGVFPFAAKSHNIFFQSLMKGLAKRGHKVDVISYHEIKNPPENYRTILDLSKIQNQQVFDLSIEKALSLQKIMISRIAEIHGNNLCELMGLKEMQQIFKKASKERSYDLVISEFLGATCYFGLRHFLKVPVVGVLSIPETDLIAYSLGNPLSAAFSPSILMDIAEIKTFSNRLKNTLFKFLLVVMFYSKTEEPQTKAMRKYLSPEIPSIREVEKNVALVLTNNYHSLHGVRPITPAIIDVGGLHISENEATFTPELKKWMDESKNGVVYFAFGTGIRLETLPKDVILAIYSSFAKISPVRVLMRIKDEKQLPSGLPKNVKTSPWIPQIPVLSTVCHNNTKVFITHCGLLGLQESLYYGVPIIGIPVHSDQFRNVQIFVEKKMGIRINYEDITEKNLDDALDTILNNSSYRDATKFESHIFRDRPMSAMDTAIFWIEYILRNGEKSLRSPAVDLQWWKVQLLDIYAFLLSCFILTIYIIKIILKFVLKNSYRLVTFFRIPYKDLLRINNGKIRKI